MYGVCIFPGAGWDVIREKRETFPSSTHRASHCRDIPEQSVKRWLLCLQSKTNPPTTETL